MAVVVHDFAGNGSIQESHMEALENTAHQGAETSGGHTTAVGAGIAGSAAARRLDQLPPRDMDGAARGAGHPTRYAAGPTV